MVLPGETIASGAPGVCCDCKTELVPDVHRSAAGYYIGTFCECGPYSRESGYYDSYIMAKRDLDADAYSR